MIPFSPPRVDDKTIEAVSEALRSGWITTGPRTKDFEKKLAAYLNSKLVACFNSWTTAAELALKWYDIRRGDEVVVPVYTYAASANIVAHLGATIVPVDSAPGVFNTSTEIINSAITHKTKAVMPVDIGGLPAQGGFPSGSLFKAASANQEKLGRPLLLSDAAHSFGATIGSQHASLSADVAGFSFHAVKNLTTAEGGALSFNLPDDFDIDEIYRWFMRMSLHGQTKDALAKTAGASWRYDILEHGYKCNMTDLQAAIGLVELGRYAETLTKRKSICERYSQAFAANDWAELPPVVDGIESSNHLYMLRIRGIDEGTRDKIIDEIIANGVSVNVHFQPLPLLTVFKKLGWKMEDFPNAWNAYSREISLPVYYDLTDDQANKVIDTVIKAVQKFIC